MRAYSPVNSLTNVAIKAKDLEILGEVVLDDPSWEVAGGDRLSVDITVVVNMIDGEKH